MKSNLLIISILLISYQVNSQISFSLDTWEAIGNTELLIKYDDIDNGDGPNDGSILVDGKDTIGPLGALYTFQGSMETGTTYEIETVTFKNTSSYVRYYVELYNLTDDTVLTTSPRITLGSKDGPLESVQTEISYTAEPSDNQDVLQVRYIRENTAASNHVARDFSIDYCKLNGSPIAFFERVFTPNLYLDITAVTPDSEELTAMDSILAQMSDIILGDAPPSDMELLMAVEDYDAQNIVTGPSTISGIARSNKSDWAQAQYLKTFAQFLKFNPDDDTRYNNDLTVKEMAVNTIWLFADQFYNDEIPFDFINYSYKLYARAAVFLLPHLNTQQNNLFFFSLYRHSRDFVFYWSPEYITGQTSTGAINEDDIYNVSDIQLVFGLMQTTDVERLQWTKAFTRYYERYMTYSPGTSDGIKPDGSSFHHFSALNNYTYCYNTPSIILPVLQGTPFQISKESYLILRDGVYGQLILANENVEPLSMVGRHPHARAIAPNPEHLKNLSIVGGAILELNGPDPILARAYVRHWGPHEDLEGIEAETPAGFIQMNYHNGGVFWKDGWMASCRGQSHWGFGAEINIDPINSSRGNNRNLFGRYQSHGSLEILYPGGPALGNGFTVNGWNWNHNPGTTSILLPWDLLKAEYNVSQREYQRKNFAGTLTLNNKESDVLTKVHGEVGMFAIDFHQENELDGHSAPSAFNHDSTFVFKKSAFFFNDFIVALGSGISNDDAQHKTVSTLFQRSSFLNTDVLVDGIAHRDIGVSNFDDISNHWILDNYNTGYFVKASSGDVVLERGLQKNPYYYQYDLSLIENNFEADNTIGYIDHGTNPENEGYEFAIIPNSNAADMADFAGKMDDVSSQLYTVIQRDSIAHVVRDLTENITGLAMFEQHMEHSNDHLIKSNDQPCLMMYKELSANSILMSLSNPDLGLERRSPDPSLEKEITIELRGIWEITQGHIRVNISEQGDSTTTLLFKAVDGLPIELKLKRMTTSAPAGQMTSKVDLFPNPSLEQLEIRSDLPIVKVEIYNLEGKKLLTVGNTSTIDIRRIPAGHYLVKVYTAQEIIVEQMIKL